MGILSIHCFFTIWNIHLKCLFLTAQWWVLTKLLLKLDTGTAMGLAGGRWGPSFLSSTAGIQGTNERENFLDAFSILHLTLSTATHSISLAEATKELFTLYSSLISLCLCAHPVLLLIVWVHCSLSSLASFLSWSHFLSHTACHYTQIHIQRTEREGKEEGPWGGRVNVWERRKERVASIRVLSVLFSWAKTWVTSSLTCQWKRKNCQIVFQQDIMQLTAVRAMRKRAWLPIIPYAFELCCVKLLCFLEPKHP